MISWDVRFRKTDPAGEEIGRTSSEKPLTTAVSLGLATGDKRELQYVLE